jgi:hypothetical protein
MTLYVRLKIVVLSFMLLLTGTVASRGEAFLCKNKAAIRVTASVEIPSGLAKINHNPFINESVGESDNDHGTFLFYAGRGGAEVTIEIDGVRTELANPDKTFDNSPAKKLDDNLNIKIIDSSKMLAKAAGAESVTVSIIYTGN